MDCFYHGTNSISEMIKIIESGGIKSKNRRKEDYETLYNGDDYISVGKWSEDVDFNRMMDSCFYGWIFWRPTFIINPDIEVIPTEVKRSMFYGPSIERVSPFIDEYHVKDEIDLDRVVGIALPFATIKADKEELFSILKILHYAKEYRWNVYESDDRLVERVNRGEVFDEMSYNKK